MNSALNVVPCKVFRELFLLVLLDTSKVYCHMHIVIGGKKCETVCHPILCIKGAVVWDSAVGEGLWNLQYSHA